MGEPDIPEPYPDRIVHDLGEGFVMGVFGGSVYNFIRGSYDSPKGARLSGGVQQVRLNALSLGGSFTVWRRLLSAFECCLVHLRQRDDPWNSIVSATAAGGFLSMRQGLSAVRRSALNWGLLVALIEGGGIVLNNIVAREPQPPPSIRDEPRRIGTDSGYDKPMHSLEYEF